MEALAINKIIKAVDGTLLSGKEEATVSSVSTNSKEVKEGAIFIPIIGERVDAHDFIRMALQDGAVATLTSRFIEDKERIEGKAYIQVENTVDALQKLGAYYRSLFPIPCIGITGSVGKTTTKEMIAAALETKLNVIKTIGNMNSQIGLPLMMTYFSKEHQVAVIEMGISEEGEMERLAPIAKPDYAVMTNIGVSHIGQLGSKENIRKEKLNIINAFGTGVQKEKNALYINGNDPLLNELEIWKQNGTSMEEVMMSESTKKAFQKARVVTFGTEEKNQYYAKNIRTIGEETHFTFVYPEGEEGIILSVLGLHNVNNAIIALTLALEFGITPDIAKVGLKQYQPILMRGQIYEKDGIKIVDDTYNASPDSMKSGVDVLLEMPSLQKRFIVLADVLELGDISRKCHYEVGEYIAKCAKEDKIIEEVVTIGKESKAIIEAIVDNRTNITTHAFDTNQEAIIYLQSVIKSGDGILIKGSRGMCTDQIVKALLKEERYSNLT